jgi:selenocysteine lyase/cysteine desulfurase
MPDDEKLAAIRELLPATSAGIYLNTADAGPLPSETARAMSDAAEWELRTGRANAAQLEEREVRLDEARAALAAILHADIEHVAVTHSAADGLAAVVESLDWRPDDVLALSALLDPGVARRLLRLAEALGLAVEPDPSWEALPDRTRLLVVPHVTPAGEVLPLDTIVAGASRVGTSVAVDGSLAAGVLPVDVTSMGVQAYTTAAHRWLLGPVGMAGVFAQAPIAASVRSITESSDFHAPSVVGMARSCGWLSMYVGLDWIIERTRSLAVRLAEQLAAIDGVSLLVPPDRLAAIVTFGLDGWPADDALDELGRRAFAILGSVAIGSESAIRVSVGCFNSEAEIAHFVEAVSLLAAHTPASLPRRPSLTILHESGA